MLISVLVILELGFLFLLSNRMSKNLYRLFLHTVRNEHLAMSLITILYLPGTIIHELSHLIVAEILRVPTGEISFLPRLEDMPGSKSEPGTKEIRMGYLKIGTTDPFRRFLIGIAPVVFGLGVLSLLIGLFNHFWPQAVNEYEQILLAGIIGYLLFTTSNSMFSSKKDMEVAVFFVPAVVLVIVALYIAGFRLSLTGTVLNFTQQIITGLSKALGVVLGINITILTLATLFIRGITKL